MSSEDEIILEVEGSSIKCDKQVLITHSDYFKAMLEGNFLESNKKKIQLKGVNARAMNIIVTLLLDSSYNIKNEDLLLVLRDVVMLQFLKIQKLCEEKLLNILSYENCLDIWQVSQQYDLKPLWILAKAMAVNEFLKIKDTNSILELSLDEIHCYLGQIYLNTDNELTIFKTLMKWWCANRNKHLENSTKILLKLLTCIDFQSLLNVHLNEIIIYPDIANDLEISAILSCLFLIRNDKSTTNFSEMCQEKARLLYDSKSRMCNEFPCIIANKIFEEELGNLFQGDKYHCLYYDNVSTMFKRFFDLKKAYNLHLCNLVSYRQYIFLYGCGMDYFNFWIYDTLKENWEKRSALPCSHVYGTCLTDSKLYVIGRILISSNNFIQNLFVYNYKENFWSNGYEIPYSSKEIKCCNFLNKFFMFNAKDKCGYFFNESDFSWIKIDINIDDYVLRTMHLFCLVSDKNYLYVKGKKLIKFTYKDKTLVPISVKDIHNVVCDHMESVICKNILYTFYECIYQDTEIKPEHKFCISTYSLEAYNLETDEIKYVFKDKLEFKGFLLKDKPKSATLKSENDVQYCVSPFFKFFKSHIYSLYADNQLINNYCS